MYKYYKGKYVPYLSYHFSDVLGTHMLAVQYTLYFFSFYIAVLTAF